MHGGHAGKSISQALIGIDMTSSVFFVQSIIPRLSIQRTINPGIDRTMQASKANCLLGTRMLSPVVLQDIPVSGPNHD